MHTSTRPLIFWAALALLLLACGKDKITEPQGDTTPPAAIADLACTDSSGDSITLRWTAPGGDGSSGRAARYDLRFWHKRIHSDDWDSASSVPMATAPDAAGSTETITLRNRTWWTNYHFALKTADSAGNWSDVSNTATATVYPDPELRFLIQTQDGVYICDPDRRVTRFSAPDGEIEIVGDRIFAVSSAQSIHELSALGARIDSVPISEPGRAAGFVALPDDRYALIDNARDMAYIINRSGTTLATVGLRRQANDVRQSVTGVVVDNSLIISEDGSGGILRVDLASYSLDTLKDLGGLSRPLEDIDYYRGRYYTCTDQEVYSFADNGTVAQVGTLDQGLIAAMAVAGGYSFVTVAESGTVYALNHTTRTAAVFVNGLSHPQDIEILHR